MSHASPRHILPALGLLAVACGTALAAPPPAAPAAPSSRPVATPAAPDPAQQLQRAARQYAELQQMLALDERCQWLEPIARTAMEATAQERLAWYTSQGGTASEAQAGAEKAVAGENSFDCKGNKAASRAHAMRYAAWQMRVTWALRAEALLASNGRPAWFDGKSPVAGQREVLHAAVSGLESRYGASIRNAKANIQQEAAKMLAERCRAKDPACPAPAGSPAFADYAEQWLRQAEAYAAALSRAKDPVGSPPEPAAR